MTKQESHCFSCGSVKPYWRKMDCMRSFLKHRRSGMFEDMSSSAYGKEEWKIETLRRIFNGTLCYSAGKIAFGTHNARHRYWCCCCPRDARYR